MACLRNCKKKAPQNKIIIQSPTIALNCSSSGDGTGMVDSNIRGLVLWMYESHIEQPISMSLKEKFV